MLRKSIPLVRQVSKLSATNFGQARHNSRSVWDLVRPSSDVQRIMRDMDRRMDAFEREFFKFSPLKMLASPRFMPVDGVPMDDNVKFRVDIDVRGFQPDDVKLSLKDGKLRVEAKMDRSNEDGSRVQQHLVREFTLPENFDEQTLESFLHNNGVLTIEAAKKTDHVRKIEIDRGDQKEKLRVEGNTEEKEKIKSKI